MNEYKIYKIKHRDDAPLLPPILNKCRNSLKELRLGGCGTEANAAPIGECLELDVFHASDVCARLQDIVGGLPKLRDCDFSRSSLLTDSLGDVVSRSRNLAFNLL
jgi:hypothetical protein